MSYEAVSVLLSMKSDVCSDPTCNDSFSNWNCKGKKQDPPSSAEAVASREVIAIDCEKDEIDSSILLLVVEVEDDAADESIVESIAQCSGMPSSEACDNPSVRRSGRRRKEGSQWVW
jgi:hypothetical protein